MSKHPWSSLLIAAFLWLSLTSIHLPVNRKAAYSFHYKGSISYAEGQIKQADQYFRRAYNILPENFYFAVSYGLTHGQRGNLSEALEVISKARRVIPFDDPEVKRKQALSNFFSGLVYAYNHDFDKAFRQVSLGLHNLPNDSTAASIFENTLGYLRVQNQARNAHRRDDMPAHFHVHERDLEAAFQHFESALALDPGNPAARANYQMLCDTLGRPPKFATSELTPIQDRKKYQPTFLDMHTRLINELELPEFDEILFLVDISGSMVQEQVICMNANRFDVMKELARKALKAFPEGKQYGLATIGGTCSSEPDFWRPTGSIERDELDTRFRFLIPDGTTPLLSRLVATPELFSDSSQQQKTIFLISDGANTCRVGGVDVCQFAEELSEQGITVNVLTFLSTTINNTNAFAEYICLAESTGGNIIYMDNYHCRLEPLSFDLLASCQLRLPELTQSSCWGDHIETLWNISRSGSGGME